MTNKEYFEQALWLDKKINSYIRESAEIKRMITGVSSPMLGEKVQSTRPDEASYARHIQKMVDLQREVNREIDRLIDLKAELRACIDSLPSDEEKMVLRCRYLCGMDWEQIGEDLGISSRTARRWHDSALEHVVQPGELFS